MPMAQVSSHSLIYIQPMATLPKFSSSTVSLQPGSNVQIIRYMQFYLQRLPQRSPLVWGYRWYRCKPRSDPEHYVRLTLNEVTLAFVLTAWMVVIVLVGYYLKVYDPRLDPFRKEGTQKCTKYPNSIDYSVYEILQSVPWLRQDSRSGSSRPSKLGTVLNAVSWL